MCSFYMFKTYWKCFGGDVKLGTHLKSVGCIVSCNVKFYTELVLKPGSEMDIPL